VSTTPVTIKITDNTHAITRIFANGDLTIAQGPAQLGYMYGTLASGNGIRFLAQVATDATHWTIGLAEAGATGTFILDGASAAFEPGSVPPPARRVNLGYNLDVMTTPTVDGVKLFQRTLQWAIGDPVNVGDPAPAAPSNFSAAPLGRGKISLAWSDTASNESGFKIERREGTTGTWAVVARTQPNRQDFIDTGLAQGVTYYYRVRAYIVGADSAPSNEASSQPGAGLSSRRWDQFE
jgi:hypothetical protein